MIPKNLHYKCTCKTTKQGQVKYPKCNKFNARKKTVLLIYLSNKRYKNI